MVIIESQGLGAFAQLLSIQLLYAGSVPQMLLLHHPSCCLPIEIELYSDTTYLSLSFRTVKAMGGAMTFREALRTRLNIIKPSFQQV